MTWSAKFFQAAFKILKTYIPVTFIFLAVLFYQASGGADFDPSLATVAQNEIATDTETTPKSDLRSSTGERAEDQTPPPIESATFEPLSQPEPVLEPDRAEPEERPSTVIDVKVEEPEIEFSSLAQPDTQIPDTSVAEQVLPERQVERLLVAGPRVNMRSGPSTDYDIVVTLPQGTELSVLGRANDWARLELVETGQVGWMAERLLTAP